MIKGSIQENIAFINIYAHKVLSSQSSSFPVVMYGCESWTIKKAECQKVDASELWCWRRLLRVPWTARRPNQSILKEINPEYSLEGLMLKLKLQYFGHLMWRTDSLEKTLKLGKIEGGRRRERQRMRWLDGITNLMTWVWVGSRSCWWAGMPGMLWCASFYGVAESWTWLSAWTEEHSMFKGLWAELVKKIRSSPCFHKCFLLVQRDDKD